MKHTPKPWADGGPADSIVSQSNEGLAPYTHTYSEECLAYYGGYVIAESVAPCNKAVLKAAPDLLIACELAKSLLEALRIDHNVGQLLAPGYEESYKSIEDHLETAIAKAKGE